MIALAKALFGDFPFEEIIDNSRGFLNGILFLIYLFVAVFILLSMFLAILGEAQAAVRDKEQQLKDQGEFPNQFGFLGDFSEWSSAKLKALRNRKNSGEEEGAQSAQEEEEPPEHPGVDVALSKALSSMQLKLDVSVKSRMVALEAKLTKQLAALDRAIATGDAGSADAAASKGRDRGESSGRDRAKLPANGSEQARSPNGCRSGAVEAPGRTFDRTSKATSSSSSLLGGPRDASARDGGSCRDGSCRDGTREGSREGSRKDGTHSREERPTAKGESRAEGRPEGRARAPSAESKGGGTGRDKDRRDRSRKPDLAC